MRNLALRILRGVKSLMPALNAGELYWSTDTNDLFIGTGAVNNILSLPLYSASGTRIQQPHLVSGSVILPAGGSTTVTLSGSAVFSSNTSYIALVSTSAAKRTLSVTLNSGSSFTISGGGTGDTVYYLCVGI